MADDGWEDMTPKLAPRRPKIFPAAFRGRCKTCGFDIDIDDPIGFIAEGEVACELCIYENLPQ